MSVVHFNIWKNNRGGIGFLVNILEMLKNVIFNSSRIMNPVSHIVSDGRDSIESSSLDSGIMEKGCISIPIVNLIYSGFHRPKMFFFGE